MHAMPLASSSGLLPPFRTKAEHQALCHAAAGTGAALSCCAFGASTGVTGQDLLQLPPFQLEDEREAPPHAAAGARAALTSAAHACCFLANLRLSVRWLPHAAADVGDSCRCAACSDFYARGCAFGAAKCSSRCRVGAGVPAALHCTVDAAVTGGWGRL